MKQYLVKLTLFVECYEKHVTHLIAANNMEQARVNALKVESHNDNAGFDNNSIYKSWQDGDMAYRVYSVKELSEKDAQHYERITNFFNTGT